MWRRQSNVKPFYTHMQQESMDNKYTSLDSLMELLSKIDILPQNPVIALQKKLLEKDITQTIGQMQGMGISVIDLYKKFGAQVNKAKILTAQEQIKKTEMKAGNESDITDLINEDQMLAFKNSLPNGEAKDLKQFSEDPQNQSKFLKHLRDKNVSFQTAPHLHALKQEIITQGLGYGDDNVKEISRRFVYGQRQEYGGMEKLLDKIKNKKKKELLLEEAEKEQDKIDSQRFEENISAIKGVSNAVNQSSLDQQQTENLRKILSYRLDNFDPNSFVEEQQPRYEALLKTLKITPEYESKIKDLEDNNQAGITNKERYDTIKYVIENSDEYKKLHQQIYHDDEEIKEEIKYDQNHDQNMFTQLNPHKKGKTKDKVHKTKEEFETHLKSIYGQINNKIYLREQLKLLLNDTKYNISQHEVIQKYINQITQKND